MCLAVDSIVFCYLHQTEKDEVRFLRNVHFVVLHSTKIPRASSPLITCIFSLKRHYIHLEKEVTECH